MARKLTLLYWISVLGTAVLQWAFGGEFSDLLETPGAWKAGGPAMDVALGLSCGVAAVLALRWLTTRIRWMQQMDADFRELVAPLAPGDAFGLATMSALAEELFFRGFLQPRIGLIAASIVFGLPHLPSTRGMLPWPLMAGMMGLLFGGLFELRGSLVAPVVAHFVINYLNFHDLLRPLLPEEA